MKGGMGFDRLDLEVHGFWNVAMISSTTCVEETWFGKSSQYWLMKDWNTFRLPTLLMLILFLLTLPMLAISTGFGRVDNSSSMFLRMISMLLFSFLELETDMGTCCPIRGCGEVFIFRLSIIVSREDRSRFLLLLSPVPQPLFEEEDPALFLLGGFVFFRSMLSQRWRWPRMRRSCEYAFASWLGRCLCW